MRILTLSAVAVVDRADIDAPYRPSAEYIELDDDDRVEAEWAEQSVPSSSDRIEDALSSTRYFVDFGRASVCSLDAVEPAD